MPSFTLRPGVALAACAFNASTVIGGRYDVKARLNAGGGTLLETNHSDVRRLRELLLPGSPLGDLAPASILLPFAGLLPSSSVPQSLLVEGI